MQVCKINFYVSDLTKHFFYASTEGKENVTNYLKIVANLLFSSL